MFRKRSFQALTIGAALLFLTNTVTAQSEDHPGRAPHRFGQEMLMPRGVLFLALSSNQMAQIAAIIGDTESSWETILDQVRDLRQLLEAEIQSGTADESTVRSSSADLAVAEEELAVVRASVASKIRAILTDEQRAALDILSRYRSAPPAPETAGDAETEVEVNEASMLY